MSGGGGSSKKKTTSTSATLTTPYGNLPTAQTFQPTLPGFQQMQANQLAAGFGGQGQDFASLLASLYKPMSVMSFKEPISVTAGAYDPKKFMAISTGNPALDKLLMGTGKADAKSSTSKDRDND